MALAEFNWNPTRRQLRQFGVIALVAFPLLAWFWGGSQTVIQIAGGIGLGLTILAYTAPAILKPVFVGLSLVLLPVGLVVGELLMLLVFLVAFVPMGILFRLRGRDRLQLRLNRQAKSYWEPKVTPTDLRRYFRQY